MHFLLRRLPFYYVTKTPVENSMGHHEKAWLKIFDSAEILFFRRCVDDTFSLFNSETDASLLLYYINSHISIYVSTWRRNRTILTDGLNLSLSAFTLRKLLQVFYIIISVLLPSIKNTGFLGLL